MSTCPDAPSSSLSDPAFVHLRLHTEYSIVDGLVRIDDAVDVASQDAQPALAITDLGNLFGLIKFYKAARSKGVKPIAGCDVWISSEREPEKAYRVLLLVKDRQGYLQLCELLTQAWLSNQVRDRAELRMEWLEALHQRGESGHLIVLSGWAQGEIGMALEMGKAEVAEALAGRWAALFPDDFYLEVQRGGQSTQEALLRQTVALAEKLALPVVATHPVQFTRAEDFTAHEARVCIAEGSMLGDARRVRRFHAQQCFKTQTEMAALFADLPGALANSVAIAKRCNLTLELGKPKLPVFPTPNGMSLDDFLVQEAQRGLEQRLVHLYPDPQMREAQRARYEARLKFETDTIIRMKFPGYFLIVADFIQWAKNNGVPVGPGRGSGAGSLVAYSLLITDLDPLAYNLLFERFLNPERVSMPDFDIDFCQEGRDRVIQYVKERYGKDAVSQIATFGTMAAKGAVRDVGRVLDLSYTFCDGLSKLIPFKPGKQLTLAEALEEEPALAERCDQEEEVRTLLDLAQQVEGITRNIGMHAGGVLIAPGKLTDFCPLYTQGGESGVVSQFDKDDVEAVGLVKFDFLGLTTLTILDRAVRYIKMLDPQAADFDLSRLPLDDRATYELLTKARTVAVFQLESRGMQGMLKDARPDRFEDIIALVALYRPGPMDLIPDFCKRKHGEKFDYPDPRTEGILSETYGIMVYQEQVMQMAQVVGGYSLGGADLLRRAMGKKKAEEMAEHRQIFRDGAAKDGLPQEKADEIFDLMEKFAGYGFNKSHAAAYALLSYHTAYLKAHHPAAFMAANMSLAMDDTDKIKVLVEDAIAVCKLEILPPDINLSDYRFMPERAGDASDKSARQIRYGLGAVKGSGQNAIENIVAARVDGPFVSLFDFCQRINRRLVNRRTIEALIKAGAMDCFGVDRAVLLASVELAMDAAEQADSAANQASLFGDDDSLIPPPAYVQCAPFSERQRLGEEKVALGYFLSGHLFDAYAAEVRRFVKLPIARLEAGREPRFVAGIITAQRPYNGMRGPGVSLTLDDGSGVIEALVAQEIFEEYRHILRTDELAVVYGRVVEDRFNGGVQIRGDKVLDIARARVEFSKGVLLSLHAHADLRQLREHLSAHLDPQGSVVRIRYRGHEAQAELLLDPAWRVRVDDALMNKLCAAFSHKNVDMDYV